VLGASTVMRYMRSIELLELELEEDWALPGRLLRLCPGDWALLDFQGFESPLGVRGEGV
jgi:hypothetical protein